MSDGSLNTKVSSQIDQARAVMLKAIRCAKGRAESKGKAQRLPSSILTCGYKFWILTERIKPWVQPVKMRFLRAIVGVTRLEDACSDTVPSSHDERARSLSGVLVNTPPLSTILRPPHQESRQFLGYADKKKKVKPSKPMKEEGNSEEVGEEHEEEGPNEGQESANEAVAISPPPEGASVAEAKPIGLAIAGPGGVAASKPQGTAVAGPGGLAIARPVGTAIAGVEVEGSVPIGGQQKNKKKPKQEKEQTEGELHYVGGLTGPIGNPQPKEFADALYYKSMRENSGNNIRDNLYFRGRQDANGYQLKLGQHEGKYGFVPMFASPVQGSERLQKRMDAPKFFHGLLGNNAPGNEQFQNYQLQF